MDTKEITCRTHGGVFQVPVKRGRPPVNCTPDNKCRKVSDRQATPAQVARAADRAERAPRRTRPVLPTADEVRNVSAREAAAMVKPAEAAPKARSEASRGITKAFQAKAQLEGLGWECKGEKLPEGKVRLTATRGVELLVIVWDAEGLLHAQDYSLWDTTVGTGRNGKPDHKLPFDPDETPDRDLVRYLSGMKVTWWNALAQAQETAIIQPGTIKVEHSYGEENYNADGEFIQDRTVKFVDHSGRGFRAFRLAALIKVG